MARRRAPGAAVESCSLIAAAARSTNAAPTAANRWGSGFALPTSPSQTQGSVSGLSGVKGWTGPSGHLSNPRRTPSQGMPTASAKLAVTLNQVSVGNSQASQASLVRSPSTTKRCPSVMAAGYPRRRALVVGARPAPSSGSPPTNLRGTPRSLMSWTTSRPSSTTASSERGPRSKSSCQRMPAGRTHEVRRTPRQKSAPSRGKAKE